MPLQCLDLPRPEHNSTAKHLSGLSDLTCDTVHSQLGTAQTISSKIHYNDLHAIFHMLSTKAYIHLLSSSQMELKSS